MAEIIYDLTLSEAALNSVPLATFNDTLKKVNVLREHEVDQKRFLLSFKFYTEHPRELKSIYDTVVARLEAGRAQAAPPPATR